MSTQHQLDQARDTAITRVVTAPDARIETARTSAGGNVTVVTSAALREAVVTTSGMASLPSSRVYQVWVISPSGARSAGLMHGSSLLASAVRPGDRIGITVEPAGGTTRPPPPPSRSCPSSLIPLASLARSPRGQEPAWAGRMPGPPVMPHAISACGIA